MAAADIALIDQDAFAAQGQLLRELVGDGIQGRRGEGAGDGDGGGETLAELPLQRVGDRAQRRALLRLCLRQGDDRIDAERRRRARGRQRPRSGFAGLAVDRGQKNLVRAGLA